MPKCTFAFKMLKRWDIDALPRVGTGRALLRAAWSTLRLTRASLTLSDDVKLVLTSASAEAEVQTQKLALSRDLNQWHLCVETTDSRFYDLSTMATDMLNIYHSFRRSTEEMDARGGEDDSIPHGGAVAVPTGLTLNRL